MYPKFFVVSPKLFKQPIWNNPNLWVTMPNYFTINLTLHTCLTIVTSFYKDFLLKFCPLKPTPVCLPIKCCKYIKDIKQYI